jgi:hypothetical protein
MGVRTAATTRANTNTSTERAPARSSARVQVSSVAPEVSTSSTSTRRRPCTAASPPAGTRNAPCTLAARSARDRPTCCRPHPLDGVGHRHRARLRYHLGEHRGLVEPPRPQPPPVQRYRHQGIGVAEDLAPGPCHPLAHGGGEVEPVAIFERMHEVAGDIVEAHRGSGAPIGGRVGDGLHGEDAGAGVIGERNPQARAIGRGDERDLGPARRA